MNSKQHGEYLYILGTSVLLDDADEAVDVHRLRQHGCICKCKQLSFRCQVAQKLAVKAVGRERLHIHRDGAGGDPDEHAIVAAEAQGRRHLRTAQLLSVSVDINRVRG